MSPEMFGRIDDAKFQTGAATMRNFIATPQGPAENRAGFSFVREVKNSAKQTRLIPFTYSTTQTMVIELGEGYIRFHTQGSTLMSGGVPYEIANSFVQADLFDIHYVQSADVLTMVHTNYPPMELRRLGATNWTLTNINFTAGIAAPTGVSVAAYIPPSSSTNVDTYQTMSYVVTAVAADKISTSVASSVASVSNNIFVTGAKNTITWNAVATASRYNVHKLQGGVYGYIGNTTTTSLIDDNIAPDLGYTPTIYETEFASAGNYPGAVSYFEQRRCFAGTINEPQKMWMTRSGTESDLSYGLPVRDDDRIEFNVAAREANTTRHIVPLTQLLMLTSSAEWRVSSTSSEALTPSAISVKPQSYIGASNVQPSIINNSLVYCAARGGHVREMGYSFQANGFVTGDLSLRSTHLFDNLSIVDMCYSKAPRPLLWFVSSNGRILGLTYVPDQQIGAWHWHDTDGLFESVTTVAEGDIDVLYAVVKRTINGSTVRYVERMGSRTVTTLANSFFVDSGATFNGTNTSAVTMTLSGGTTWTTAETLTVTSSTVQFVFPGTTDVNDAIVITDSTGVVVRCRIVSTSSTTVAQVRTDKTVPVGLRNVATTSWSFARNSVSGITWLEGKTVSILVDGAVHPQRTVTAGVITLDRAGTIITFGLPYNSDLQSMPMAVNIDAFGQGRAKNVNKAWLRVYQSSGLFIGPTVNTLVEAKQRTTEPYGSPPELRSTEIEVMLTPTWAQSGQIYIRQQDPLPLTIVGLTLEVSIGS